MAYSNIIKQSETKPAPDDWQTFNVLNVQHALSCSFSPQWSPVPCSLTANHSPASLWQQQLTGSRRHQGLRWSPQKLTKPDYFFEDYPRACHVLVLQIDYALRQKAGLRSGGQRSGGKHSEYHRQFGWKKPTAAAASPILTAEQVRPDAHICLSSHRSGWAAVEQAHRRLINQTCGAPQV